MFVACAKTMDFSVLLRLIKSKSSNCGVCLLERMREKKKKILEKKKKEGGVGLCVRPDPPFFFL